MILFFNYLYRTWLFIYVKISNFLSNKFSFYLLKINKVKVKKPFYSSGIPNVFIHHTSRVILGVNFKMNNTLIANPIGRNYKCLLVVKPNAFLSIGENVGMSGVSIVCSKRIKIGNNVKLGGNVCIYDTDFHSLDYEKRMFSNKDAVDTVSKGITIGNNVFIGAHSTILKGVEIGDNSIVGACSLVSKTIPPNQIWGGNPANFLKNIDQ